MSAVLDWFSQPIDGLFAVVVVLVAALVVVSFVGRDK